MLRTDGHFDSLLDRKLTKLLTLMSQGICPMEEVRDELKSLFIMAMRDDVTIFAMISEGDPMLGDDEKSLDGFEEDGTVEYAPED